MSADPKLWLLHPMRGASLTRKPRRFRFAQPPATFYDASGVRAGQANPKDCQKVAGGRSASKTSGHGAENERIPQGWQTLWHAVRGASRLRGFRRFRFAQPPATCYDASGVHAARANPGNADVGSDANGVNPGERERRCCAGRRNPKDCQKVAGGRSAAKTSGGVNGMENIPEGWQNARA